MKAMNLEGKTALITGSTSGIGQGVALALAGEGANVIINGFGDDETIAAAQTAVAAAGAANVRYSAADMSKPEEIRQMISDVEAEFGAVDILVNNAGIQHVESIEAFPEEKWDAIITINLTAVFHTTKAVLPAMRRGGWGRIVNVASAHGLVASVNKSAYVAAKHGVMGLTKTTALETAGSGITCNAICPGWVMTPLVEKQIHQRAKVTGQNFDEAGYDLISEKMPSGEAATTEQIGAMTAFLCSDAAKQISGVPFSIDGGWTAQ